MTLNFYPINHHIQLSSALSDDIFDTHCRIVDCEDHYCYKFALCFQDCIFDIEDKNYLITFKIDKEYFEKYANLAPIVSDIKHQLCTNSQSKIVEIIKSDRSLPLSNVLIESNLLYLIYKLDSTYLKSLPDCESCAFLNKPNEREKIFTARNYIINHLDQTISIPKLATLVGTNQCYLKKGFKEVYNLTIFEFVVEQRMLKAKHLLLNTDDSISYISMKVGYGSVSSFSVAFKNYYAITPKEMRINSLVNVTDF